MTKNLILLHNRVRNYSNTNSVFIVRLYSLAACTPIQLVRFVSGPRSPSHPSPSKRIDFNGFTRNCFDGRLSVQDTYFIIPLYDINKMKIRLEFNVSIRKLTTNATEKKQKSTKNNWKKKTKFCRKMMLSISPDDEPVEIGKFKLQPRTLECTDFFFETKFSLPHN